MVTFFVERSGEMMLVVSLFAELIEQGTTHSFILREICRWWIAVHIMKGIGLMIRPLIIK